MKKNDSSIIIIISAVIIGVFIISIVAINLSKNSQVGNISEAKFAFNERGIIVTNLIDQVAHINSLGKSVADNYINDFTNNKISQVTNKTIIRFSLPPNTIVWSYYIGVDQASQQIFANALSTILNDAGSLNSQTENWGPLAELALDGSSLLTIIQSGENVQYSFTDSINAKLFLNSQSFSSFRSGNVVNDFSRMDSPLNGQYFVCLSNDNYLQPIDVIVKVTAICTRNERGTRLYKKTKE